LPVEAVFKGVQIVHITLGLDPKGDRWHLSVSPTLVLACLGNATASLPLRGQPRRKALRCSYPFCQRRCAATATQSGRTKGSYPAGQVRRKEKGRPYHRRTGRPLASPRLANTICRWWYHAYGRGRYTSLLLRILFLMLV